MVEKTVRYDPGNVKVSCGVGLALNIDGRKDHRIV